jgi:hypothetical protein
MVERGKGEEKMVGKRARVKGGKRGKGEEKMVRMRKRDMGGKRGKGLRSLYPILNPLPFLNPSLFSPPLTLALFLNPLSNP